MLFGETRTRVTPSHALIAPDGHVETPLPGWQRSAAVVLISPQMGARFTQYLVRMDVKGQGVPPMPNVERFFYVLEGSISLKIGAKENSLPRGGYAYLPADTPHVITADIASRLTMIERRFLPLDGIQQPQVVVGHENEVAGEPFLGDEGLILRKLLPEAPGFDMAVNTMTFEPGTPLPFVETHVMEHGLLMLQGAGIYRLSEAWYPVQKGDVIWMGPYCPQWFGPMGRGSASYLLYKDVGRDPFVFEKGS